MVCARCGWRPSCACGCGQPVAGRRDRAYADPRHRFAQRNRVRLSGLAGELAAMSEARRRRVVREAWEIADPGGGRLKLRYGKYHPAK